jgi:hypothetical protein
MGVFSPIEGSVMAMFANVSRTVVIKAKRETVLLLVAASSLTFALAYAIHSKPEADLHPVEQVQQKPAPQIWAGQLASLAPDHVPSPAAEPMSSASLVVPKSQLSLPVVAVVRPPARVRACDDASCAAKTPLPVRPVRAQAAATQSAAVARTPGKQGLMATLNPLNHLPDATTLKRPFSYASDTVSGWFHRL